MSFFGPQNQHRLAEEQLVFAILERLIRQRVAVIDTRNLGRAIDLELNQIIRQGTKNVVGVNRLDKDITEVFARRLLSLSCRESAGFSPAHPPCA